MINIKNLENKLLKISKLGWVDSRRLNNKDGAIGNTFEDLLGVEENNNSSPDYKGIEIKTQRFQNNSFISLFSKSPSYPKSANTYLRENFGEVRNSDYSDKNILYASIFGNRFSSVYNKYCMKLNVNYENSQLELIVKNKIDENCANIEGNVEAIWSFDKLKKAAAKIEFLLLVNAETRRQNNIEQFRYNKASLYYNYDFDKFLKCITDGYIMMDLRIGVYKSGKNAGKTHDHGSGFRISQENIGKLYHTTSNILN